MHIAPVLILPSSMLFRKGRCFIDGCQYVIAETLTKNPDFVLEMPENGGYECKKRTKMGLLCAFLFRKAAQCGPRCLRLALGTAQLWSNHLRTVLRLASGLVANEPTACEPTVCGADCLQSRLPAEPTTCGAEYLRSQPPAGLEA